MNIGYSGTVREGVAKTVGRYVAIVDTYFAHKMTTVFPLVHPLQTAGVVAVLVSRFKDDRIFLRGRLLTKLLSLLFSLIYRVHIDDLIPGCVAYEG
ncbi:MAG: hypothetical protein AAB325_06230, partial [Pseudomonadota bacterium]